MSVKYGKLLLAIQAGKEDLREDERRSKEAAAMNTKAAIDEFGDTVARWKEWLEPRIYNLVRKATHEQRGHFDLGMDDLGKEHTIPWVAGPELVRAVELFDGLTAVHYSEETNMQDSSAPCWETHHFVTVRWSTE